MSTKRSELTWAEKAYRVVAQAIPSLLASGHVSRSVGLWLAGVFVFLLVLAAVSTYLSSGTRRLRGNTCKRFTVRRSG